MAEYLIQDTSLVAIADAIRDKTGSAETLSPSQMVSEIENMELGSDVSVVTATAADVLSPKIFVNASGEEITGTIATKTASNLSASGATVSVPAGYYASNVSKAVSTATQATPSITVSSAGLITASATQTAGYVAAGTKSATKQLTTKAATTITPGTSAKTAVAKNVYTTGAITVAGDADLKAANIKSGVNIFGVAGTYTGPSTLYAGIGVTYPAGSTCTCTNGTVTYTASDTTGQVVFSIPSNGTWTVTCTNGNYSASQIVNITARGQSKNVPLSYSEFWIFKSGSGQLVPMSFDDTSSGVTMYITENSIIADAPALSYAGSSGWTNSAYNLFDYTKLYFDIQVNSSHGNYPLNIGVLKPGVTKPADWQYAAVKTFAGTTCARTTFAIDISALLDSYVIGWHGVADYEIFNIWCEA